MTDQQIIERLAVEVMGWEWVQRRGAFVERTVYDMGYADTLHVDWSPLTDWNHWRQVELKIMEDEDLWNAFTLQFFKFRTQLKPYMKSDLTTRVDALLAALDSLPTV